MLSGSELAHYLSLLSESYRFISLDEAAKILAGHTPAIQNAIVVTFDDGYLNNLTTALPILRKLQIKPTIFLPTGLVDNHEPMWVDRLDYAIGMIQHLDYRTTFKDVLLTLNGESLEDKKVSFQEFRRSAKQIECDDLEFISKMQSVAAELEVLSGSTLTDVWAEDAATLLLRWDQARAHTQHAVFGSHTVNHIRLAGFEPQAALRELDESKSQIEDHTLAPCNHFAYPNGSFDLEAAELVKRSGYTSAVTTIEGQNSIGCDLYSLKRIALPTGLNDSELLARVSGLSASINSLISIIRHVFTPRTSTTTPPNISPEVREMSQEKKQTHELTGQERLLWNTLVGWISQVALFITGFIMPRVISDELGQTTLGIWDFCWTFVNYISFMDMGFGPSSNRYVAQYRTQSNWTELNELLNTVLITQIVISTLVLFVTGTVYYTIPMFFSQTLGESVYEAQLVVLLLGASIAVQIFFSASRGLITGYHRWDIHNGLHAGFGVASLGFMILALYQGYGIIGLACAYLFSTICFEVARAAIALNLESNIQASFRTFSHQKFRMLLGFTAKNILIQLPKPILVQTVNLLVVSHIGPAALAVFARPMALIRQISTLITKFSMMLTPIAGSLQTMEKSGELAELVLQSTRFTFAATIPAVTTLLVLGDIIMLIWMGETYVNSSLMAILTLGYLLVISQDGLMRIMIGLNTHGKLAVILSVSLFVVFLTLFFFIIAHPSLTNLAILLVVPLTITYGLILPYYVCQLLQINLNQYLIHTFIVPLLCNGPLLLSAYWLRENWTGEQGITTLLLALGGSTTLGLYYKFLLSNDLKLKLKQVKFGLFFRD